MVKSEAVFDQPLAIVGIGCLFPKADGLDQFWANIVAKIDCITDVPSTHWRPDDYYDPDPQRPDFTYARRGGFLDLYPFSPAEFGISPRDLEAIDTAQLLGLVVAKMALEDAGLLAEGVDRGRISAILGVTGTLEMVIPLGARLGHPLWKKAMREAGVDDATIADAQRRIATGYVGWQENSFPGLLGNVVAGRIANRLNLGGTNCVVDAACASSLSALHLAALELTSGRADAVLTGGVDTFNDIFMYMCFSKTPALSPTGNARPFSVDADGTILGEGLGMFVLKRLADAEHARDRIYAVIRGMGTSSDGAGSAVYAPTVDGQVRCLRNAYDRTGISPSTIGLVEAHGTGTKVGDAVELSALSDVLTAAGAKAHSVAVGSIKSQIGHTKAAAGAAGLIKAALSLYRRVLPPTIKVREPAASVSDSPLYVNADAKPWLADGKQPRRAAVSSFGFGGSNYHALLEEHESNRLPFFDGNVQIVALSAGSESELHSRLRDCQRMAATNGTDWSSFRRLAGSTRATFRRTHRQRLTFVVQRGDTKSLLAEFDAALGVCRGQSSTGNDIFYHHGEPVGRLGMLFPGQGSQSIGMLADLACAFPAFQNVLAEADRAYSAGFVDAGGDRLSSFIYPDSAFSSDQRNEQEMALRDTAVAQPALGAVCLGALNVLRHFGLAPDIVGGHSYGELSALCAAGCFDAPSLFAISQLRGRLMAGDNNTDRGAMLAVMAPLAAVESAVNEDRVGVVVANRNSPTQAVLSGPSIEIEKAERTLTRRKFKHLRLPVAAAFHSPLVADAAGRFRAALEPLDFQSAQLPVFANSTSREYPRDPQSVRDLLAAQIANPVDFISQIRNMWEAGATTFLEVGPGRTLTRLVGAILENNRHAAIALDDTIDRRSGVTSLAFALARLAALGHGVDLTRWDPAPPPERKARGPIVPICGANYRSPQPDNPARRIVETSEPVAKPVESKPPMDASNLLRALQISQDSLAAFQKLQEQTADLHRIFLEQQAQAQATLQSLVSGQQSLITASLGVKSLAPPIVAAPKQSVQSNGTAIVIKPKPQAASIPAQRPLPQRITPPTPTARELPKPSNDVSSLLLSVVAEKTGYPTDMLDLDMGLDADLGIDSIKRVEILSALQEKLPHASTVAPDRLGTLRTLRDVVVILESSSSPNEQPMPYQSADTPRAASNETHFQHILLSVVSEKTGYPIDMLDLDMQLDSDLGIDSIKRVEILSGMQERLPDQPTIAADRLGSLQTLRDVMQLLRPEAAEKKNRQPALNH